jgi:hypothetical protein
LTNRELRAKVDDLALELKQAKTIAAQGERRAASSADHLLAVAAAAPPPPPTAPPPDVIAELQRKLEDEKRQNEQLRGSLTKSNEQLRAAVTQVAEVKEATHSHLQMGAAVHPGALGAIDPSMDPSRLKVSELKAILRERNVAFEGAVERQDLLDLVMAERTQLLHVYSKTESILLDTQADGFQSQEQTAADLHVNLIRLTKLTRTVSQTLLSI